MIIQFLASNASLREAASPWMAFWSPEEASRFWAAIPSRARRIYATPIAIRILLTRFAHPRSSFVIARWCRDGLSTATANPKLRARKALRSIEIRNLRAKVNISSSILGPIEIQEDEVNTDPIPIEVCDSIIDGMDGDREAIIGPSQLHAHAIVVFRRCTVFGVVQVHAIELPENSVFKDCVHVARRQIGCMSFCYVPASCRTPKRFNCQPDLVIQETRRQLAGSTSAEIMSAIQHELLRVVPQFTARHYGQPSYCQLAETCACEIKRGADDASEMRVFQDLFQPQRMANLRARLEQYTPADMDSGVILVN